MTTSSMNTVLGPPPAFCLGSKPQQKYGRRTLIAEASPSTSARASGDSNTDVSRRCLNMTAAALTSGCILPNVSLAGLLPSLGGPRFAEPVTFPRKRLDLRFAVLMMHSVYEAVDNLNLVPTSTFQSTFWKRRQQEYEPYLNAYRPIQIKQGDLTDPLYFDYISFAQIATIGDDILKTAASPERPELLAKIQHRIGDLIFVGMRDGFRDEVFNGPPELPAGAHISNLAAGVQSILDIFVDKGFALKASVREVSADCGEGSCEWHGANGSRGRFTVRVEGPADLWGMGTAGLRGSQLRPDFVGFAVEGFLRASKTSGMHLKASTVLLFCAIVSCAGSKEETWQPSRPSLPMEQVYPAQVQARVEEVLQLKGVYVAFQELSYTVRNHADRKSTISLLKNVSGLLQPYQMTALMGPSGSGKTTALDVLAGRKTVGQVTGKLRYSGMEASASFLRRYVGYVEQHDTLLDNLTVVEQLRYTSELKNGNKESAAQKRQRVEIVIEQLGLEDCRDVTIGTPLSRGISGGQCKRTSIGCSMVTTPPLLFLDEPTSGLDSFHANEVMEVLKSLIKSGMTVCATIHNPTPFIFNLFDHMMILLHGRCIYAGGVGHLAVQYFETLFPDLPACGSPGCRTDTAAEWIVDVTTKASKEGKDEELESQYKASLLHTSNQQAVQARIASGQALDTSLIKQLNTSRSTSSGFFYAAMTILKFRMKKDFKDHRYLGPRILDKLVIALVIMTLYWKEGKRVIVDVETAQALAEQYESSQNIASMLFVWTILPLFAAATYMPQLVLERLTYYRERADGLYTPLCYLACKLLEELLIAMLNQIAFTALIFYPVYLSGSYASLFLTQFCTTAIGIALGYLIAAVSPNMEVANAVLPAYAVVMLFFVGLIIRVPDMPHYWKWMIWLNPLHYAWVSMMVNQFSSNNFFVPLTGERIETFYGIDHADKWNYFGYETCFFFGFFLAAWIAFSFVKHQKR